MRRRRLLVGVAQASVVNEPRQYLIDMLAGLTEVGVEVQVAMFEDGPVREELERLADVRVMPRLAPRSPSGLLQSLARRRSLDHADRVHDRRTRDERAWIRPPDCIHLHGPRAVNLLRYVRSSEIPVTTYVHPWDFSILGLSPLDRQRLLERCARYLVADDTVVDDLVAAGVDATRIEGAPDPLRFPPPPVPPEEVAAARTAGRTALDLPLDDVIVGIPGVVDWVDAPELTLAVGWEMERQVGAAAPTIAWFGMPRFEDRERRWPIEYDIERMGLRCVRMVEEPLPAEPYELFDIIVLPLRTTEPLSERLVATAALRGVPVFCWEGHPLADAVRQWRGVVVDRADVRSMASLLLQVTGDAAELRRAGQQGWLAAMADVERVVPLAVPAP